MIPEDMQRTMQFLLENQAGHDARLAAIEVNLNNLTEKVSTLADNVSAMANTQHEMQDGMLAMQSEFREGFERLVAVSEETSRLVGQVVELEARTIRRVNVPEERVDALKNSGE